MNLEWTFYKVEGNVHFYPSALANGTNVIQKHVENQTQLADGKGLLIF